MTRMAINPSDEARERLGSLKGSLVSTQPTEIIWRGLTEREQTRVGGTLSKALTNFGNIIKVWQDVHGVSYHRAIIDAGDEADLLKSKEPNWLLDEFGELPRDPKQARRLAIERGHLVIDPNQLEVYYKGKLLSVAWENNPKPFAFFLLACQYGKRGALIRPSSIPGKTRDNIVTQSVSNLKRIGVPGELTGYFRVNPTIVGTQWFTFPRERIHVVDFYVQ